MSTSICAARCDAVVAAVVVVACVACVACACACGAPPPPHHHPDGSAGDALLRDALLHAVTSSCTPLAGVTPYSTDDGAPATITPCALPGAVAWQSDLDVDCDGGKLDSCKADPSYLPDTSATTANGDALDANTVPFVVVPLPGHGFDYGAHDLALGNAAYVIFNGKLVAGVFGDEGPPDIIGEASFAMAQALGIDADPVSGGADAGATFIVFAGDARVDPIEDHDEAERVAKTHGEAAVAP